jgi:hypothetical protein
LPPWLRGFRAGVCTTLLIANIACMMAVGTGTIPRLAGIDAEKSMARDLRTLEKHGWTLVNHLLLEKGEGDVDHFLLGPAGLVVVETKWAQTWSGSAGWCIKIAKDAKWRTGKAASKIGQLNKLPTHSIVAVHGPAEHMVGGAAVEISGTSVLPGSDVVTHILALPAVSIDASHLAAAHKNLDTYIAMRDKGERTADPLLRALWAPAVDVVIAVHVAMAVLVIVGSTIRIKPEGVWTASLAGLCLVSSLVVRRRMNLGERMCASVLGVGVMSGALLVVVGIGGLISLL